MSVPVLCEIANSPSVRAKETAIRHKLEGKIAFLTGFNHLIMESTGACVLLMNSEGQVLSINKAGRELLQIASDREVLRRHWINAFPGFEGKRAFHALKLLNPNSTFHASSRTKCGGQKFWSITFSCLSADTDNDRFLLIARDVSRHLAAEEQVLAYQAQLQFLASEAALIAERERRRIATHLHDRIGQGLAFARLKIGAAENRSDPLITQLLEIIDQAISDTRSLTFELSPPVLHELGLIAGLEWLARKIQQEHGILIHFHDDDQSKPVDDNFSIVLFQAVRELLINVVKHARASRIQVLVRRDANTLRITVEDDGIGLEIRKVSARSESRTFGLFNVRERVEYLGGRVNIQSERGSGTQITLIAPLKLNAGSTT